MGRAVGAIFVLTLAECIFVAFRQERTSTAPDHGAVYEKSIALQEADPALTPSVPPQSSLFVSALVAVAGLGLVVFGGKFLVEGAVSLARGLGISETVIGLTFVAVGTQMPELVTSIVAGLRKQGDVAFGNIVGSNIYNILGIGGFTALIAPGTVPVEIVSFDNLVMIGVSLVLVGFAWTGLRIARWEGALSLAGYVAYVYVIWA